MAADKQINEKNDNPIDIMRCRLLEGICLLYGEELRFETDMDVQCFFAAENSVEDFFRAYREDLYNIILKKKHVKFSPEINISAYKMFLGGECLFTDYDYPIKSEEHKNNLHRFGDYVDLFNEEVKNYLKDNPSDFLKEYYDHFFETDMEVLSIGGEDYCCRIPINMLKSPDKPDSSNIEDVMNYYHMQQFDECDALFSMAITIEYLIRAGFSVLYHENSKTFVNISGLLDIDSMETTYTDDEDHLTDDFEW